MFSYEKIMIIRKIDPNMIVYAVIATDSVAARGNSCVPGESPSPFPRGSLGSVVLLRALATPVRGCRLVPVGLLARRLPLLSCADAFRAPGKRRKAVACG